MKTRLVAAATVLLSVGLAVPAAAAPMSDVKQGWIRVYPAAATLDTAIDTLTESPCPAKTKAVIASVDGPGIPADPGLIVGNTQLKSFPLTSTGQVYVPLSQPLSMWFAANAPGLKPKGTYKITVVCRDKFYPTEYARFTGDLSISKGRYQALGEAAKPFDAEVFRDNGLGDPVQVGGQSPTAEPEQTAAASASPEPAASTPAAQTPTPASSADAPAAASPSTAATAVAAPQQPAQGSGARWPLIVAALVLLAGVAVWSFWRRGAGASDSASASSSD